MNADDLLSLAREVLPGLLWYQLPSGATWVGAETALGGAEITCWHNGKGSGLLANLWGASTDTPRAALEALRTELERRHAELEQALGLSWVPVSERLPETDAVVLCVDSGVVYAGRYGADPGYRHAGKWWGMCTGKDYLTSVTHWRPIPAPPKEADRA